MRSDERIGHTVVPPPTPAGVQVEGHERLDLTACWRVAACPPDACSVPADIDALDWVPARVPGTAAGALKQAGAWDFGSERDFDAEDWWFHTEFESAPAAAEESVLLRLDGVATVHEVFLNGERVGGGESMFAAAAIDVGGRLRVGVNELAIRCRSLAGQLGTRRKPRARWRTRLVDNRLRFFRTMLLGRCPGFAAGPAAVGPWRPVWIERRRGLAVTAIALGPSLDGDTGTLTVRLRARFLDGSAVEGAEVTLTGPVSATTSLGVESAGDEGFEIAGELRLPAVRRWWPHTHGEPTLYAVSIRIVGAGDVTTITAGQVGFRELSAGPSADHDVLVDGIDLHVNGVPVFARGALWTPDDFVGMAPDRERLLAALARLRDAGMNMVRIPGTGAYESRDFHDICDELGILVWQDFMFANLDYPIADDDFRKTVGAEVEAELAALAGHPSLAVLCGNSEIEQQVGMLGLDSELGRGELFGEMLPAAIERSGADAIYLPSAPCGGERPYRPDRGVANYFGVGGYRRPLTDARLAEVRFASECLAFANVPEPPGVNSILPEAPADIVVHHPRWKAGVARDAGTGWDFDDVRDHYLRELFGVDPGELRRFDHERYLELSRAVSAEMMCAVFGEWRRGASPCGGGLVLWLRDLVPGAGWGLVDNSGAPKQVWHALRRALAPRTVWLTDEGLAGIGVHIANDAPEPLRGNLRIAVYGDAAQPLAEAGEEIRLDPHSTVSRDLEAMLGHFLDASWAYRFGPPARAVVATLVVEDADEADAAPAFLFPAGPPLVRTSAAALGLAASARAVPGGAVLELHSETVVYGVRIRTEAMVAADDAFALEPGRMRRVALRSLDSDALPAALGVEAVNLAGRIRVPIEAAA
jgi:beta-mannosidase